MSPLPHRVFPGFLASLLILILLPSSAFSLDPRLATVNDWLYVLQPSGSAGVGPIAASAFDLAVIDYASEGDAGSELTPAEIATLKAGGRVVLAYLSIGEAETYRFYWDADWNDEPAPDPDAPSWLGPFNPDFPDNYKVRYWQAGWQSLLFGTAGGASASYLDRIIDQGFDGIYLDIIDAFTFWSEEVGERSREQARQDMIALVSDLVHYARVTRGVSNFLVFPQNGLDVIVDDDELIDASGAAYLAAIDGVGVEDLFYDETSPQNAADTQFRRDLLNAYLDFGGDQRLVILVDYVWNESAPSGGANVARYNDFHQRALADSYQPYAAVRDRDLDEILTVAVGSGFSFAQPKADAGGIFADSFQAGNTSAWSASVP